MNKFRFFLSALICMLSLSSAWAFDYTDSNGVTWTCDTYTTNGVTEAYIRGVSNYSEHKDNLIVPETVTNGTTTYTVTSVGHPTSNYTGSFYNKTDITSVTIPTTVRTIGYESFRGCSGLTSVEIPNSVTSIGSSAFYGCSGLTSVVFGNSVTNIGSNAFYNCSGLTSVVIPNSVTTIGQSAFYNCSGFTSVVISNSVTSIGSSAFSGCSGLTSVEIPNSVTSIGNESFRGCSGLTSVVIPNSVTSIGSSAFYYCSGLTSVEIPNSVTSIGGSAFYNCSGLETVKIGSSVTTIGSEAFGNCSKINEIYITGVAAWCNILGLNYLMGYGANSKTLYINNEVATNVVIPEGTTTIPDYAFRYLKNITSVSIPNSVTSIGNGAFSGCSGLTSVEIPNSVTSIGSTAFSGCSGLTSVEIGNSVTSIGNYAFQSCSALTSVEIGNSVTSIGQSAFSGCSGLTSVVFGNSVTNIGSNAFYNCSGLTSVEIGSSVTSIGSSAFESCSKIDKIYITDVAAWCKISGLDYLMGYGASSKTLYINNEVATDIVIPEGPTTIPQRAFYRFMNITSVTIPNSVTSIGSSAFSGCSGLTSMTLPFVGASTSSLNNIGYLFGQSYSSDIPAKLKDVKVYGGNLVDNAFADCKYLEKVTLGEGIQAIGANAFKNCTLIKELTIPASVTSIGSRAFYTINDLEKITMLSETPATLGARDAITDFSLIYLPSESAIAKYEKAENWADHQTQFFCEGDVTKYAATVTAKDDMSVLHQTIGEKNLQKVVSLNVSGTINSYDMMIMRNKMVNLKHLDLSEATIVDNSYEYYQGYHSVANSLTRYALQPNLFSVKLPSSITSIEPYALIELKHVDEIEIPANVESLGEYAANGLTSLKKLTFAEDSHLKTIGSYAFQNCSSLTELSIPESVTSMPNSSLWGCSSIEKFTLEDGEEGIAMPYLAANATNACPFKNVYIGRNITTNDYYYVNEAGSGINSSRYSLFYSKSTTLSNVTIGHYVTSIPKGLFSHSCCDTVVVASSLKKIDTGAFYNNRTKHIFIEDVNAWSNIEGLSTLMRSSYAKDMYLNGEKIETVNLTGVKTMQPYAFCHTTVSGVFMPTNSELKEISNYAFAYSGLNKLQMPTSITKIGTYAFYSCPELTEVKLPSSIHFIGNYAFYGNPKLNDVYTYTIEPQEINQQTFSTYKTATLHCPNVSYYNYYYNTQWSQFLELVAFDEPYDYIFIDHDVTLDETTGEIKGEPDADINAGGGLIGEIDQYLDEVHIKFDGTANVGASLIGKVHANKIYLDMDVKANYWYYFTFPFNVDLMTIQKTGGYVFRYYDGEARANGASGWKDVKAGTDHLDAGKGYIFRTNEAGVLSICIDKKTIDEFDLTVDKLTDLNSYTATTGSTEDGNKSWNFIGNPYLCYYSINDLDYGAPIIVWNGSGYEAFRPGDDDLTLYPFQAFFVQKPDNVDGVGFENTGQMTYIQSQAPESSPAKARKAAQMNPDRKLVNLTITNGENTDKTRVVFNEEQLLTFEAECDASKFDIAAGIPQMFTIDNDGVKYAINERPMDNGRVKMGYAVPQKGQYTINAPRMDVHVYIEDAVTGATYDLSEGEYTFSSEAGTFANRFTLVVDPADVEATSIMDINSGNADDDKKYDLSGRRAQKSQKGVIIVNGRKEIVK